MRWISGKEQPPIFHGDDASTSPYAGIVCLDDKRYIVASTNPVILSYVVNDEVKSSITLKSIHKNLDQAWCAGIQISDTWSEVYVLMHTRWGKVFIERVAFSPSSGDFTWHPTAAFYIPTAYKPRYYNININWKREQSTISTLLAPSYITPLLYRPGIGAGRGEPDWPKMTIGPSFYKYPPVFTRVGTHLIIGINHVRSTGVMYTHQWDYTPREEFMTRWIDKIKNSDALIKGQWLATIKPTFVDLDIERITTGDESEIVKRLTQQWITERGSPGLYHEGEWWRYERHWEWQQQWGYCPGDIGYCQTCGTPLPCTCINSWTELPSYVGTTPVGNMKEIDRIWCRTLLQHPGIVSSTIVMNTNTGAIEEIKHLSSTPVDKPAKEINDDGMLINGIIGYGTGYDISFAKMKKYIPKRAMLWGDAPLGRDPNNSSTQGEWPLYKFLQWYGIHHLPWLLQPDFPMLDGENYTKRDAVMSVPMDSLGFMKRSPGGVNDLVYGTTAEPGITTLKAPYHPLTMSEFTSDFSISETHGVGRTISAKRHWKYEVTSHEYVSYYKDQEIGRGQDIAVGMVIASKPKTIQVLMINNDWQKMHLEDIVISVVPSNDYPSYSYVDINGSGMTFNIASLKFGDSITFDVTIEYPLSQDHPKPVLLKTEYNKVQYCDEPALAAYETALPPAIPEPEDPVYPGTPPDDEPVDPWVPPPADDDDDPIPPPVPATEYLKMFVATSPADPKYVTVADVRSNYANYDRYWSWIQYNGSKWVRNPMALPGIDISFYEGMSDIKVLQGEPATNYYNDTYWAHLFKLAQDAKNPGFSLPEISNYSAAIAYLASIGITDPVKRHEIFMTYQLKTVNMIINRTSSLGNNWVTRLDRRFDGIAGLLDRDKCYVFDWFSWDALTAQPSNGIVGGYSTPPLTSTTGTMTNSLGHINLEPEAALFPVVTSNGEHWSLPYQWKSLPFTSSGWPSGYCLRYSMVTGNPDPFTPLYDIPNILMDTNLQISMAISYVIIHEMGHALSNYNMFLYPGAMKKCLTREWLDVGGWPKTGAYYETAYGSNYWAIDGQMVTQFYGDRTDMNPPDPPTSVYGATHPSDDWAECYSAYVLNRNYFKTVFPNKYAVMDRYLSSFRDMNLTNLA